MQLSQLPVKFQTPFASGASGAYIRTIPVTTPNPNAASQTLGWPPTTMTAEGAGGVPPDGRDMNGLDNQLSAWAQWFSIGGVVQYDATIQALIGGYPQWSVVGSVATPGTYWQSSVDNNTSDPDTGGSNWNAWPASASIPWSAPPPIGTSVPNVGHFSFLQLFGNLVSSGLITTSGLINSATDLQINGVGFSESFGPQWYQKLPSGLIIQGGEFFSSSGGHDTINFPVTFPNNCSLATCVGSNATGSQAATVDVKLAAGFASFQTWTWEGGSITSGLGVRWLAAGN